MQEKIEGYEDSKGNFFTSREEALAKGVGKIKSCIRQRMGASHPSFLPFTRMMSNILY